MAWIESHQEMARHPKTRRVALRLGISKAAVIGHLHLLWWWTLDFAPDGDLSGFDAEEVAAVAEWEGDAEQFLQALLDTGWLDEGRRVHNWGDYAGRLVTVREGIRERQRRCREKKRDAAPPRSDDVIEPSRKQPANVTPMSRSCHGDVTPMSQLCHGDVTPMSQLCHADVTVTSPLRHGTQNSTEQNQTQPNRERVARGRAGGPAERSAGVPSLSRSREVVSEPAPVGGERPGRVGDVLPRDGMPAPSGGEARPGADSGFAESAASVEGGRFSTEAERSPGGAGNAFPPDSEAGRERRGPERVDERGAPRGEEPPLRESHAPLRDGGESRCDEGPVGADVVSSQPDVDSLPEGSFAVGGLSLEEESQRVEGEASRDGARAPRENGRALRGAGSVPLAGEPLSAARNLPSFASDGADADGRFSTEGAGMLSAGVDASFDPERLSAEMRESVLVGAAALEGGGEDAGGENVAGGPLDYGLPRVANGGNAPPMGEEAREALRQDAVFREAWRGWRLHLADLGRPLMSRGQERALLRECARRGPERAVEVISYSITKGAKNLIWDDAPRARRAQQPAAAKGRVPNPEGWPEWLAEEYPDRTGIDYADAPESVQGEFRRALQKGN